MDDSADLDQGTPKKLKASSKMSPLDKSIYLDSPFPEKKPKFGGLYPRHHKSAIHPQNPASKKKAFIMSLVMVNGKEPNKYDDLLKRLFLRRKKKKGHRGSKRGSSSRNSGSPNSNKNQDRLKSIINVFQRMKKKDEKRQRFLRPSQTNLRKKVNLKSSLIVKRVSNPSTFDVDSVERSYNRETKYGFKADYKGYMKILQRRRGRSATDAKRKPPIPAFAGFGASTQFIKNKNRRLLIYGRNEDLKTKIDSSKTDISQTIDDPRPTLLQQIQAAETTGRASAASQLLRRDIKMRPFYARKNKFRYHRAAIKKQKPYSNSLLIQSKNLANPIGKRPHKSQRKSIKPQRIQAVRVRKKSSEGSAKPHRIKTGGSGGSEGAQKTAKNNFFSPGSYKIKRKKTDQSQKVSKKGGLKGAGSPRRMAYIKKYCSKRKNMKKKVKSHSSNSRSIRGSKKPITLFKTRFSFKSNYYEDSADRNGGRKRSLKGWESGDLDSGVDWDELDICAKYGEF